MLNRQVHDLTDEPTFFCHTYLEKSVPVDPGVFKSLLPDVTSVAAGSCAHLPIGVAHRGDLVMLKTHTGNAVGRVEGFFHARGGP
eukprot:5818407-Alexandrium_andersonii.AAC.1